MGIQIRRQNLFGSNKDTLIAGYDNLPWHTAILWLNKYAKEEAAESRVELREKIYFEEGFQRQERILVDCDGVEVVKYYLKETYEQTYRTRG